MQDFNNSKGFYMKKDDLITRCKLLKGERDESIFTILIGIVVKLGLVGLAFYLLLGSTIDWSSWKTYAAMLILCVDHTIFKPYVIDL
ncbi:hypothetical protein E8U94_004256 [Escherichia coli]|nr:hypothetical protein [Escherichia coli]